MVRKRDFSRKYTEEEKQALLAVCKCGQMNQYGYDQYTKLLNHPPLPIKGFEPVEDESKSAVHILDLVRYPAYKHWKVDDAVNVVVLQDLKWRNPVTEKRNASKAQIDSLMEKAEAVYKYYGMNAPTPKALRQAIIDRRQKFSPPKTAVAKRKRADGTMSGIGSDSYCKITSTKVHPGYKEKCEKLNEDNKRKRVEDDGTFREKTTIACREHRQRKAIYRKIDAINLQLNIGGKYMATCDIDAMVTRCCSEAKWEPLGGRTMDEIMSPDSEFSAYIGITRRHLLDLEAFDFLVRGVGYEQYKNGKMVPPITFSDGSYINVPNAKKLGFVTFKIFESPSVYDCKRFEEFMQLRYARLPYVTKVLFKQAGAGAAYVSEFSKFACVYVTAIPNIKKHMDDGIIVRGNYKLSMSYNANRTGTMTGCSSKKK